MQDARRIKKSSAASGRAKNTLKHSNPPHDDRWEDSRWCSSVRRKLVRWYRQHGRDLPWRRTRDPYAIWVSEIMLQQTQVTTVIPYYERFLSQFPNVQALAIAHVDDVLKHWEGLGYYRRARQMHAAADVIVNTHGGIFPNDYDEVLALPGIGRYTAGAILSFSADQRLPIVEANTNRLFSRLIALRVPPSATAANRLLWDFATALLPTRGSSSELNQATMEVGSLICSPKEPQCGRCPVRSECAANEFALQTQIPGKVKAIQYEDKDHWALVVRSGEFTLMRICPPGTHWAGMWDFPRFDVTGAQSHSQFVKKSFAEQFGFQVEIEEPIKLIRHSVTKYRISLQAHRATPNGTLDIQSHEGESEGAFGWFSEAQLETLALNTSARKIVNVLKDRLF